MMGKILFYALGFLAFSTEVYGDELSIELEAIKMIESSDGTNTNHRTLETGMHAGTRAGGHYGIMPIVAKEVISKNPKTFARYSRLLVADYSKVTEELNTNRRLDTKLARVMWAKLRKTRSADEAACAWFWGPYADRCKDPVRINADAYVNKFREALSQERISIARN